MLADMPGVGADLQDHLQMRMQCRCTDPITMNDVINNWRHRSARAFTTCCRARAADDQRRLCRRFLAHAAGTRDARRAGSLSHLQRRGRRRRGCIRSRASCRRCASCARRAAASCASSRSDPGGAAGDPAALSARPRRLRHRGRGAEDPAPGHGQPAMRRYIAEEWAARRAAQRRRFPRLRAQHRDPVFHPTSTCRMGTDSEGGGRRTACGCAASRACA